MQIGWSIVGFIVAFGLLVTVHEFGHFWMARKLGFKVLRFSIGFGKPLFRKVGRAPDHTEYVIAVVPLGGYVRMLDQRDGDVPAADLPRAYASRPPWQRILVLLAGPAANILFAILVLWGLLWAQAVPAIRPMIENVTVGSTSANAGLRAGDMILQINGDPVRDQVDASLGLLDAISDGGRAVLDVRGRDGELRSVTLSVAEGAARHKLTEPGELSRGLGLEFWRPKSPPLLAKVIPGGPAERAGLQPGDLILAIDDQPMKTFEELRSYVQARPGMDVLITLRRDGSEFSRRAQTVAETVNGQTIGLLKFETVSDMRKFIPDEMRVPGDTGPVAALGSAVVKSWQMTVAQGKFFVRMITGDMSTKNISGVISIARFAGQSARAGVGDFLILLVLLSLSLGFLNLLPIPILDGGQIVYQVAEWAKGGPLSDRAYMVGQQAGLVLLALLMGLALFNDLSGIFGRT